MAKTIGEILRAEISQIDDNIYQYIEGNYINVISIVLNCSESTSLRFSSAA